MAGLFVQRIERPSRVTKLRKRLDAANVGVRAALKCLRAKRAAQRDQPVAVLDAGEPFAALDGMLTETTHCNQQLVEFTR